MSDWPSASSLEGHAVFSTMTSLTGLSATVGVSTAWPSANLAIFIPIRVPVPVTVYKLGIGAGVTAAGNFDVGVYDRFGNRLVSSGATAKGDSTEHVLDVTDTPIGSGLYYLAMAADGTDNYIYVTPPGTTPVPLARAKLFGTLEAAASYPLPATVAMVSRTTVAVPNIAAFVRRF